MTNIEDVIKRVALECHVGLQEDDAVMTVVPVMNQIVEDFQKSIQASQEQYREQHEEIAYRWREDAGNIATGIVTAALNAGKQTLGAGMSEGAAQVIALIRKENTDAVTRRRAELQQTITYFRRYCQWIIVGNTLFMVTAALALFFFR